MLPYAISQPKRIQARSGSDAERYYIKSELPGQRWPSPKAIAPGVSPAPLDDLIFHGGKTVAQMEFQNVFLGGQASWRSRDVTFIDTAITRAMQHKKLDNVMKQYFPGQALSCDARALLVHEGAKPAVLDEPGVQAAVTALFDSSQINQQNLGSCIFNLILPPGSVLKLGRSSSLRGLGGYHGSLHVRRAGKTVTLYYSANVFSQMLDDGTENGIAAFDQPWKNVVATLYHEMNEFRTDADVNDAIENASNDFLGWNSRSGQEVGDQPIFQAGANLALVFKQVSDPSGKKVPAQLMYSNAVHGAEGPIARPH